MSTTTAPTVPAPTVGPAGTATYPDLVTLRRPAADHSGLTTAILPTAVIARRAATAQRPAPTGTAPAGYVGRHRGGGR